MKPSIPSIPADAPLIPLDAAHRRGLRFAPTMLALCLVGLALSAALLAKSALASKGSSASSSGFGVVAFTIEERQKLHNVLGFYSSAPLSAKAGQTVDYYVVVKDTGNTTLTLSALKDSGCEGIAGGPTGALASGGSASYTCHHALGGPVTFENTASITATPPALGGLPVTQSSNTVVASVAYEPAFTIEILQRLPGSGGSFTPSQLSGHVGDTIDYEILVKNTGNAAMTFATFTGSACDAGTVSGGPGAGTLAPGEVAAYYCEHLLSPADQQAGAYPNSVTIAGSAGEGSSATSRLSNTVVVTVPSTPPSTQPSPSPSASVPPALPQVAVAGAAAAAGPAAGAAAVRPAVVAVPTLHGPSGCVRASFAAGIASAGVRSVTFSLDGRRLQALSSRGTHAKTLSVWVDVSRLAPGAHRLAAAIVTQGNGAPSRLVTALRTLTFRHCAPAAPTPKSAG